MHTLCWHCHSLDLNSTCRCAYNKLTSTNQLSIYWPKSQKMLFHTQKKHPSKQLHVILEFVFGFPLNSPFQIVKKKTLHQLMFQTPRRQGSQWRKVVSRKPAKSNLRVHPFPPSNTGRGKVTFSGNHPIYKKKWWYWYFGILFKFNFNNSNTNSSSSSNNNNNNKEEEVHRPKKNSVNLVSPKQHLTKSHSFSRLSQILLSGL